jgi:hypothetical protein
MKKGFLVLFWFCSLITYSQSNDLASISTGKFLGFSALFNQEESLFGYLAIYSKGKESPTTEKFEYVYFDKNLNKVANNDFIAQNYITSFSTYIDTKGNIELYPIVDSEKYAKAKKQTIPTVKLVNLKDNSISDLPVFSYEDDKLVTLDANLSEKDREDFLRKFLRSNDYLPRTEVNFLNDGSIFIVKYKYDPYKRLKFDYGIIKYDSNKNELWRFDFNKDKKAKIDQTIDIIYFDFENIYLTEKTTVKKDVTFKLIKINLKSGLKEIDMPINNYSEHSIGSLKIFNNRIDNIYNKRRFDDKIVFVGQIIESLYSGTDKGCFRMIIDKKTNEVKFDNLYYSQIQSFISAKIRSANDEGYRLVARDFYFFKDGSIGFMFEKFKGGGVSVMGVGGNIKTTDLVYVETNESFIPKIARIFEKDITKGFTNSDYLFSRYGKEIDDVVFFYKDFQKESDGEKNWNLYINTIRSGVVSSEKIPISSKTNAIIPYVAKEGYILLREYNKESKYNGIRLEKLNN